MTPRAEFLLRVVDENDQPITHFGFDVNVGRIFSTSFATVEHPGGEVRVPLDTDPFGLRVFAPGHASTMLDPLVPGQFSDPLVVHLTRAARVRGEVRSKGGPLANARVTLAREDYVDPPPRPHAAQWPSPIAISDSEGRFELTIERAGTIALQARHLSGYSLSSAPIEVRPGSEIDGIVLEIGGTGTIQGRVLRHDGLPGANLGARVVDDHGAIVVTSTTDAQGEFTAAGLAPGRYRVRIVNTVGHFWIPKAGRSRAPTAASEWPCDVEAGKTAEISIRLGMPAELRIHLELPELVGGQWSVAREFEDPSTGDTWVLEESHVAGAFDRTQELLDPTAYFVLVEAEVPGGPSLTWRAPSLEPGVRSVSFAPGFGRIRGRMASAPADGRTMRLIWAGNEWRGEASIVLGPDGTFEFPCVPAGACQLSFESMPPRKVDVKAFQLTDCGEW
jgi:hypothetical protein